MGYVWKYGYKEGILVLAKQRMFIFCARFGVWICDISTLLCEDLGNIIYGTKLPIHTPLPFKF
jgi:hypothetical protein